MEQKHDHEVQDEIRIDIVRAGAMVVLFVLTVIMLVTGVAACIFALHFLALDFRTIVFCVLIAVFCVALTGFVTIYKRFFGKRSKNYTDIEFNAR